jgi:hypothetical protein
MADPPATSASSGSIPDATSHAARHPDAIPQVMRINPHLSDAQKATRDMLSTATRKKNQALANELDELLTSHEADFVEIAKKHAMKTEAIQKLVSNASRFKKNVRPISRTR